MRIAGKGLIDRNAPLSFRFDGTRYEGFQGDTLASALLANGVTFVGRSFKYHRPRGILSAGSEEPNALVTLGRGAHAEPNARATMQELHAGLEARSQNAWPALGFDLMAVNDLAAPFLGAGFYYKTFMWPRKFWEAVYEPVIRRAAGLGALSGAADPDLYERAFAHCDLLVIGAGPAGLSAALRAARGGADVILACEEALAGGRLTAETGRLGGTAGSDWAAQVLAELDSMANVRVMRRTTVTGAYDGGMFGAVERVARHLPPGHGAPLECFWRIHARHSILASGAIERPVAFANNDRPGIMLAGALRAYLNRWGVCPGAQVTVFGNNDDAHRTAFDLAAAGVHVAGLIDSRPEVHLPDAPFPVYAGTVVCDTRGRRGLEAIKLRGPGGTWWLQTDCLGVSGGWNPALHLTCHLGARPVWDAQVQGFVPSPGAVPGMIPAGASRGRFSTRACLEDGAEAAAQVLDALGKKAPQADLPEAEDAAGGLAPLWAVPGRGRAFLDFQNDVSVKDVTLAAQENFRSVEHMKRYTTQGMATDQGKVSNVNALAVLADATGRDIPGTGITTFRPPYVPVAIAAMGAGAAGQGFAPHRLTTSDAQTRAMGAPMIEAGLWHRPSYFPREGESCWQQSCDREVALVRAAVGVCDVSTLGKIDVQGPDAAALLDFVYTNMMSTLKVGRVRYGLMLREDGHVMDDGTCARLGETHFVITTTTQAAGPVMRHLEFVRQCLRPDWRVSLASVTEHWAQFAVAGPRSRDVVNGLLKAPVDDAGFPFMACGAVQVLGVAGRLFRISFSGEHAYEIAVPARYGASLFAELVQRAEALDGGAYGMEALNVLRIEKGFLTHAEMDGRVTAADLGMGRMVSASKDCIGKTMAARPGLSDPARPRLVGLRARDGAGQITAGAHLFAQGAAATRENSAGHVTSAAMSRQVGGMIGLGFLAHGAERHGEVIRMVDHLRGLETEVEVCAPCFFDQEGERLRG